MSDRAASPVRLSRVLMTADAVGGVWTYALELSRALGAFGIEVVLATMGPRPSVSQRAEAATIRGLRLVESDHRLEWMPDPWEDVERAGDWLLGLEAEHAPDVIHVNGYAHGALPFRAPVVVVAHSCVLSWFRAVKGHPAPAEWSRYHREVQSGLRRANRVVAISRAMLDALESCYGSLPGTAVVHNGRDPARFRPARKEPFVFAAGRIWDEAKNLRALERAADRIGWPVYLAGDDGEPPRSDVAIAAPPSSRRLGRLDLDEVAGWMARASIYAFPAKYEPFGLSVLEAALSGCALVLGDLPSLREVWGDAARFVPSDDTAALAREIEALARDDAARSTLGLRARTRAAEYGVDAMARRYLDLYAELVAEHVLAGGARTGSPLSPRAATKVS